MATPEPSQRPARNGSRRNPKAANAAALLFTWGSLAMVLVAGLLLLHVFQEDVEPYVGYYILAVSGTAVLFIYLTVALRKERIIPVQGRVPIVIWTCIVLAAGLAGTIIASPKIAAENMATSPRLTWIDGQDPSTSITISWITTFPEATHVLYSTNRWTLDHASTDGTATRFHHVTLSGLAPNQTYYYQVPGHPVKQFKTAPVGQFNYTFYAWSDHRTNTDILSSYTQPNAVASIASYAATTGVPGAFTIFTGDMTSKANDYMSWKAFFDDIAYQDWTSNKSLAIAYGNHERYGDAEKSIVKNYFPYPQKADTNFFYSFDYGGVHFIMLDPYLEGHSWASNFTTTQLAWLEADLAAHQDANFTLIFMHPPPSSLTGVRGELIKLVNVGGYRIDMAFCGHQHVFERRTIASTPPIDVLVLGLGGNPNNEYKSNACDTAFARFDVTTTAITVTSIFINGTILDSFTIAA